MKNKEFNHKVDDYKKALTICLEIQNKGLATVFFDLSGHVNTLRISIHTPVWKSNQDPQLSFLLYGYKNNDSALERLNDFLKQEKYILDQISDVIDYQKEERHRKFLELKKEFEETV